MKTEELRNANRFTPSTVMMVAGLAAIMATPISANNVADKKASSAATQQNANTSVQQEVANDSTMLTPGFTELDDLVITGETPKIQSDGGKLTYNVDEDDSAKSSSVLDMLRKVPMVTVDAQDNIKIKGDGNFKIYVNGHENPMLSQNASTILKSMPAASVSKVEVITEPGAKYDAEGTGGILNIIIGEQKQSSDGVNGTLTAAFGRQENLMGSANISAKKKNVSISANGVYLYGGIFPQENTQKIFTEYYAPDAPGLITGYQTRKTDQDLTFQFGQANLNMTWEPTDKDTFTATGSFMDMIGKVNKLDTRETRSDASGKTIWETDQHSSGKLTNLTASASASYQHNFSPRRNSLSVSYLFNYGRQPLNLLSRYSANGSINVLPLQEMNTTNYTREHTVQADYENGFGGDKHLLETGVKGIFRHNSSNSFNRTGSDADHLTATPGDDMLLTQIQNVYSVYGSYTATFGNLGTQAGLRYEHTYMGIDYRTPGYNNFRSNLDDVVPNAALTWSFDPVSNIRLAYHMRISRPSIQQINPFIVEYSVGIQQQGNPDLKSERDNTISLSFQKFGRIFGGNVAVSYSNTANMIENRTILKGDVFLSTYANIGKRQKVNVSGFLNVNIIPGMTANVSAAAEYVALNAPSLGLKNHGWNYNANLNWSYRAPRDYNFAVYAGLMGHPLCLEGRNGAFHWYGISAGKDLLKDKSLNITLTARNFFEDRIAISSWQRTSQWYNKMEFSTRQWSVGVSLTWKFGNLNHSQIKRVESKIVNDDVNTKSGGNGGISSGSGSGM